MTDQQLRDLLHERVRDVTTPDLSGRAWRDGQRRRRQQRIGVVGAVVAATVIVSGAVALLDSSPPARPDRSGPVTPGPGTPTPTPSPASSPSASTVPDGFLGSLRVYYAPTLVEEEGLPPMASGRPPLPEVIDVRDVPTSAGVEMDRAVAAVRTGRHTERAVVLVSTEGEYAAVDTSQLSRVGDAQGNMSDPESAQMLAPDGRHLAFPQGDHLMVLELATEEWRRHDLPPSDNPFEFVLWRDDQTALVWGDRVAARVVVTTGEVAPDVQEPSQGWAGLGRRASYYTLPVHSSDGASAQSWFSARPVKGADAPVGPPEVLVVETRGRAVVAAFPDSPTAGPPQRTFVGTRSLGCCPASTWVAPGVPAYLSLGETMRLIAWHSGTDRFEVVSEVVGWSGAISFADLSR